MCLLAGHSASSLCCLSAGALAAPRPPFLLFPCFARFPRSQLNQQPGGLNAVPSLGLIDDVMRYIKKSHSRRSHLFRKLHRAVKAKLIPGKPECKVDTWRCLLSSRQPVLRGSWSFCVRCSCPCRPFLLLVLLLTRFLLSLKETRVLHINWMYLSMYILHFIRTVFGCAHL